MTVSGLMLAIGAALVCVGVLGLFVPVLPGVALIFLGIVLVAWADHFERIGPWTLAVCALLTLVAWAADYAAGALGAKTFGASKWGIAGAFVGLLVGLPFGPLGVVVGPALGAVAGEYWRNRKLKEAARAGTGVVAGFVVGLVVKTAIAFTMIGIAGVAWWW